MSSLSYRPAIDGLRAIAVISVILFHLDERFLPGGFVGVDIFFVISGYLITSIILVDIRQKRFCFTRFYQRRIARIFPVFALVSFCTLAFAGLLYSPQDFASAGAVLVAAMLFLANCDPLEKLCPVKDEFTFSETLILVKSICDSEKSFRKIPSTLEFSSSWMLSNALCMRSLEGDACPTFPAWLFRHRCSR